MELLLPFFFLIPFGLIGVMFVVWIWALVDALQVPADVFYRSGSKMLWGILIGVMGPLAAIVYLAAGRPDAATRDWMAQQRAAGVDLRAYRVYDQPSGWGPSPYGGVPPYGPGYGQPAAGHGQVGPPPGHDPQGAYGPTPDANLGWPPNLPPR